MITEEKAKELLKEGIEKNKKNRNITDVIQATYYSKGFLDAIKLVNKTNDIHNVSSSLDDCWNSEEDDHWDEYEDPNVIND